jgi:plasmid replication initiation protein
MDEKQFFPVISDNLPKHIKKGHQLVFSRQDLSAREADMFALMIAHMAPTDWDTTTPRYRFSSSQLSEWLGVESKHVGSNLAPVAERLASRSIGIKMESHAANGDEEFEFRPLFKNITYKSGMLTMVPNDELKTEYIEFKQGFALINTKNYFELKKEYSKRLYELLSRFKTGGTDMHAQTIDELKGLFGLLDERGKLKTDKTSFKNNSVFMQRCIRDSIEELNSNPLTKKELLFLESSGGDKGFETIKKGRRIVAIRFLYRWINTTKAEELNLQEAQKTIRELELKRLQHKQTLTIEELQALLISYRTLGREEVADKIETTIAERLAAEQEQQQTEEFDSVLSKIDELQKLNQDISY